MRSKKEKQEGVVVGSEYVTGKRVSPSFDDMMKYKFSNPYVAMGIDELSEAAVGSGFYTTCENDAVKTAADDWMEHIGLDAMNRDIASDIWACGNSILEKLDPNNLQNLIHLPIGSFYKIYSDKYGNITKYRQKIGSTRHTFEGADVEKLILIRWNVTGTSPLGHGLLESLLNKGVGYTYKDQSGNFKKVYRPSFREIMEEIEDAMRKIVIRYVPRFVYKFYGMDDTWVTSQAAVIKTVMVGDDLIVGLPKKKGESDLEVDRLETDPRSRLHPYTEYFHNGVITGLQTPSVRLFIEAGFTEASARTAVELRDQKVASFRRWYKRVIEQHIVKPKVLQELGLSEVAWKAAKFRVVWNPLEPPKFTNEQLIALLSAQAKSGVWVIKPEEIRNMFKKRGFELEETPEERMLKKALKGVKK